MRKKCFTSFVIIIEIQHTRVNSRFTIFKRFSGKIGATKMKIYIALTRDRAWIIYKEMPGRDGTKNPPTLFNCRPEEWLGRASETNWASAALMRSDTVRLYLSKTYFQVIKDWILYNEYIDHNDLSLYKRVITLYTWTTRPHGEPACQISKRSLQYFLRNSSNKNCLQKYSTKQYNIYI